MSVQAYLISALILAVILDLWLIFWTRRNLEQRGITPEDERAVYLFNTYSPVLTWFKNIAISFSHREDTNPRKRVEMHQESEAVLENPIPAMETAWEDGTQAQMSVGTTGRNGTLFGWFRGNAINGEQDDHASSTLQLSFGSRLFEWVLIAIVVLIFGLQILDLSAETRLPGNESEVFQMLDWTLINALTKDGQFPLWNPYLFTGIPFVADPMLHVYNPVVTVPVLILGVRAGFKLGVFLSFLIAAFGMWRLGRVLGMGRATRIWMALMYAFAGQPVARFFQGQYLFVLGFAWIPWIVSSLFLLVKTRRRRHAASAAVFMALLFFSGNVYYQFFMLVAIAFFGLTMFIGVQRSKPYLNINFRAVLLFALTGVLALGVIAIQLYPLGEFWPHLGKDLNIEGSHTIQQIFLDYTSKDTYRPDAFDELPAREEFYAYIGLAPFLSLGLLPLAILKRDRKPLLFFGLLLVFVVFWISLDRMPWRDFFVQTKLLFQFRHLLRILVFGSFALIVLAGYGIDSLWKLMYSTGNEAVESRREGLYRSSAAAGMLLLGVFMLVSVGDLFVTNRQYINTQDLYKPAYDVMGWLRSYDPADYYVRNYPNNAWHDAMIANEHRIMDVWYHFVDIRSLEGMINQRPVNAEPHYVVRSAEEPPPESPEVQLVSKVESSNIFRLPQSLPMAFTVDNAELQRGNESATLRAKDVTTLAAFFPGPNKVEVIAEGGVNQSLVSLITNYPGWRVTVDGERHVLKNIGGYLGTDVLPGIHKYVFSYQPNSFYVGLIISLIFSGVTAYLFLSDLELGRDKIRQRVQTFQHALHNYKEVIWQRLPKRGQVTEAVYRGGQLLPDEQLNLAEDSRVRIAVEADPQLARLPRASARRWWWATADLVGTLIHAVNLEAALFAVALSVYLLTRLIGLTDFPIFFFTDEAVHPVLAADLVRDGFENYAGDFLPTFFENGGKYRLGFTVYLHVLPTLLFGKSVFVTRATSVLVTLLGAYVLGLILRDFFKLRYWWSGVLFLSITPTWFLHSRTAFEYAMAVTFYVIFLYFYLKYRFDHPRYLYAALVTGAMSFYSYSPMQLVMLTSGVLLLISDLRYHIGLLRSVETRSIVIRGVGLLLLLVLPYARFAWAHPEANYQSVRALDSYWIKPLPLMEKLKLYFSEYLAGLDPRYWFLENDHDLVRHQMKGYGHILLVALPFVVIGLVQVLRKFRQSEYRLLLVALLAAPTGTALIRLGITRALVMVIPLAMLTTIGVNLLLGYIESKRLTRARLSVALFAVLSLFNFAMMRDALVNGPTWFTDYSLGGMQYGASQLFDEVLAYRQEHPQAEMLVSPSWANGTDVLARFFSTDPMPFQLGTIDGHLNNVKPLNENMVFVVTPEEMERIETSGKFKDIQVDKQIPYPDGRTGFYFVRLRYADSIEQILETEIEKRRQLQETVLLIDDQGVLVKHSTLDIGEAQSLFDGDLNTVARTLEANPMVVELEFNEPHRIGGLYLYIGSTEAQVTTRLYTAEGSEPVTFIHKIEGNDQRPDVEISFREAVVAQIVRLEILDLHQGEPGHVHVWEIDFR